MFPNEALPKGNQMRDGVIHPTLFVDDYPREEPIDDSYDGDLMAIPEIHTLEAPPPSCSKPLSL